MRDHRFSVTLPADANTWAAGADASGLHVVAVWESKAQADRYAAEQLFPAFQESGLASGMMEMTDYDADEFYLRS